MQQKMDGSDDASASAWEQSSASRPTPNAACVASNRGREEDCGDDYDAEEEDEHQLRRRLRNRHVDGLFFGEVGAPAMEDVSLREWLDRPGRAVDLLECLHIFRQIVEAVSASHTLGVIIGSVRPSCFVMSPISRVTFVEPDSCSTSSASSDSCEDAGGSSGPDPPPVPQPQTGRIAEDEEAAERREDRGKKTYTLKEALNVESEWYTSPEEAAGGAVTYASDVYQLGVLLFELFYVFGTMEEKLRTMSNLRHRVLPPQLLLKWPKQASFCLWLLHPHPDTRPKMSEVLQSEFMNQPRNGLEDREAALTIADELEDQDVLFDFLSQLQKRKQETADRLQDALCFLSADIDEALNQQSIIVLNSFSNWNEDHSATAKLKQSFTYTALDEDSVSSASRKRLRPVIQKPPKEEKNIVMSGNSRSEGDKLIQENILAQQSSRLMKNFRKLEAVYFSTRCRLLLNTSGKAVHRTFRANDSVRGSLVRPEISSSDDMLANEGNTIRRENEQVNPFLEGLRKYLAFSKLKVRADLKQGDLLNSVNLVCSMGFDRDKEFFATAGVNKKIKIFECDTILSEDRDVHYPVLELANTSKISSVCWNGYIKSQIASSDFDGAVQVWDVTRSQVLIEMREHDRRVWSVDFSFADPTKLASGSDDGAVKLWNINQAGSIGTIRTKANVCSVNFLPESAHALAIGSADHKVYCFDLRNLRAPCYTLGGHMKTVSYVKYLDSSTVVSASTDNTLKLWDLSSCSSRVQENPLQTFTGHTNVKNFVGLSISDGYIATGSETNEVFVYHKVFPMPVLSYKFSTTDPLSGQETDGASQFISCVCWRGKSSTLLAASSSGNIKILEMV